MSSFILASLCLVLCLFCMQGQASCGTAQVCNPDLISGVYDCESSVDCVVSGALVNAIVDCNKTSHSCVVSVTEQNVQILGGTGGASAKFGGVGPGGLIECQQAPSCQTAATNNKGVIVKCQGSSICNTTDTDYTDCGFSAICGTVNALKVDCNSVPICDNQSPETNTSINCGSAGNCTVYGRKQFNAMVHCGNSTFCDVTWDASAIIACQNTNTCIVSTNGNAAGVTVYCRTLQQCARVDLSVTICYNDPGDESGPCNTAPPMSSPTTPPVTALPPHVDTLPPTTSPPPTSPPILPVTATPTATPALTASPPAPQVSFFPTPPPPPPHGLCITNPPAPNAVCVNGTWFVPAIVVSGGQVLSFNASTQIPGDLILHQNSTLQIITVTGSSSTLVDVSGCLQSDNASLVVQFTSEIGDLRSVDVASTACFRGSFAVTKVVSLRSCQKYHGETFYNGARLSVLLQNNEAGCHTQTKYVILALIFSVIVVVGAVVAAAVCCWRQRDRTRRLMARRNPNAQYTNLTDK